jgi:hypothetical protein
MMWISWLLMMLFIMLIVMVILLLLLPQLYAIDAHRYGYIVVVIASIVCYRSGCKHEHLIS